MIDSSAAGYFGLQGLPNRPTSAAATANVANQPTKAMQVLQWVRQAINGLRDGSKAPPGGAKVPEQGKEAAPSVTKAPDPLIEARQVLRRVRRAINEFRDDRWDGLVRQRNQLIEIMILTRSVEFTALGFALLLQVPWHIIVSVAFLYLVGALVGFFNRIRLSSSTMTPAPIEDYGLTSARTLQTPLYSGLAAVGGVLITGILLVALNNSVPTSAQSVTGTSTSPAAVTSPHAAGTRVTAQTKQTATSTSGAGNQPGLPAPNGKEVVRLEDIFNLTTYPFALVLAGIFGLTPELVVSRLQQVTDQYKKDLGSTQAPDRASGT